MLNSPLGKLIARKANVRMMSERSGIPLDKLIDGIGGLIRWMMNVNEMSNKEKHLTKTYSFIRMYKYFYL